jgi:glyoxylase-like metal-dependent hydrolase (beta-lactamase superfamily II)
MSDDSGVVFPAQRWLSAEVPLSVHLIKGSEFSVLIDSGVSSMRSQLEELIGRALGDPHQTKLIFNTHSHHDHMGCNASLKRLTGALIVAPRQYADWHHDFDLHYRTFALEHPELIDDTPEMREDLMGSIDGPHHVDVYVSDGFTVDLGGGVRVETLAFPGHMDGEVGFFEHQTSTLVVGDSLTGVNWSFFHGYSDVDTYLSTLARMRSTILQRNVRLVRPAHYPCLTADRALDVINRIEMAIFAVDRAISQIVAQEKVVTLASVWTQISHDMGKARDFRGLRQVEAHLRRMVVQGVLSVDGLGSYRPSKMTGG